MSIPILSPVAPGTRKDCYLYTEGADMQYNIADPICGDATRRLVPPVDAYFRLTLELFDLSSNPSLNTSSKACAPDPQYQYCMQLLDDSLTSLTHRKSNAEF
ncbi:hypothetical protein BDV12DRAFT_204534 [Aspergillus spectabilis]